jgi:hypothetical protein
MKGWVQLGSADRRSVPLISIVSPLRMALRLLLFLAVVAAVVVCYLTVNGKDSYVRSQSTLQGKPQGAFDFVNSIGVNTHLNYFDRIYGNFPLMEQELKSIGIRHLRDGVHLQNQDYNEALYGRWIKLGTLGVRFDAVLDPRSNLGPLNAAFLEQVDRLAGHTIESFEGPNELDISNVADWPSVDRTYGMSLFESTRAMTGPSQIRVIGPSLAFASHTPQLGNISNQIDEGNLHPYPAGKMPSIIFPEQIDLAKIMAGDKGIVFTESGYHNAINDHRGQPGISEAAAAKYIPRLFLEDFAHGVLRTYLYEFMDETTDPGFADAELDWGLVRADGSEKPAFFAMKNLIAELSDIAEPAQLEHLDWTLSPTDSHIHCLLLEKSSGKFDLVFWQEISSYDLRRGLDVENPSITSVLTLGRRARNITLYDPVKQSAPIHTFDHPKSVPLGIADEPLVVEIEF